LKHVAAILSCCLATGDCRGVLKLVSQYVLDSTGSVIKRHRLNFAMPPKKVTALVESDGMREDTGNVSQPYPGRGDQIVLDAQSKFTLDKYGGGKQEVQMFGH
jgi:hypothetical protein